MEDRLAQLNATVVFVKEKVTVSSKPIDKQSDKRYHLRSAHVVCSGQTKARPRFPMQSKAFMISMGSRFTSIPVVMNLNFNNMDCRPRTADQNKISTLQIYSLSLPPDIERIKLKDANN